MQGAQIRSLVRELELVRNYTPQLQLHIPQGRLKSLHTMSKIQRSQIKINIKNMFKTRKNFQLSKVWSGNCQVQVQRTVRRGGAFEVRSGSIVGQGRVLFFPRSYFWGFPGGSSGKESACQCRRCKRGGFNPWVRKIPWGRKWQPTPVFLPGKSHGQRSLEGSSPWVCKELDTTEQLSG